MGYGRIPKARWNRTSATFYAAVATNTAYDIVTVMLDLYRITRRDRYRECTGDTRFDAALLRWSQLVDESSLMMDQAQISLLVATQITGDSRLLERATAMALRGIATDSLGVAPLRLKRATYESFDYLVDAAITHCWPRSNATAAGPIVARPTIGRPGSERRLPSVAGSRPRIRPARRSTARHGSLRLSESQSGAGSRRTRAPNTRPGTARSREHRRAAP